MNMNILKKINQIIKKEKTIKEQIIEIIFTI